MVRGGVQLRKNCRVFQWRMDFNSRGAWGSSTCEKKINFERRLFQFPWCVGEFNSDLTTLRTRYLHFNSRGAWGSSTIFTGYNAAHEFISIPVVRGGVQHYSICNLQVYHYISIPVVRGGVQRCIMVTLMVVFQFQFPWCVGEFNGKHLYYLIYLASRV